MTDRTTETPDLPESARRVLARPVALTRAGLFAERLSRAFWPFASVVLATLAALMFGLAGVPVLEVVWGAGVIAIIAAAWTLVRGIRAFRWPTRADALRRLDARLPGRPIAAVADRQAVGAGDAASEAVWTAHLARMAERLKAARAEAPRPDLPSRDPFALRYVALVAFVMALLFGSLWRVAGVTDALPGAGGGQSIAAGPAWEGWVEPPAYTGRPSLYLNDIPAGRLSVPEGSRVTLRLYGEVGALAVDETVSARVGEVPPATDPSQTFVIRQDGRLAVSGPGGREWQVGVEADAAPEVALAGEPERDPTGRMRLPYAASDDYGVVSGAAEIVLDLDAVDRRYGLAAAPEAREPLALDLPMPFTGDRTDFTELLVEDLARHPFAGLPVELRLSVSDAAGQTGETVETGLVLPTRRFFDPLAAAIAEQRRDLLWTRANARRIVQVLRAVSYKPEEVFDNEKAYLRLRIALRRLDAAETAGPIPDETVDEIAEALWEIAVMIEEGDITDALARLRRAQDRLAEAIENGATDEEIAELMQELREAMQDYMRQLAQQQMQDGQQQAQNQGEMQEMTGDQLEQMLQQLQELMEQGRMAEAERLLEQLRQMMENMQIAQGQGQQGQSPGQQAMEGLAETLRQQQGLSDEAFRDLQEQFNPGMGENGQPGQPGQQGQPNRNGQPGEGGSQSLADRQQALRDELDRQMGQIPGQGTPDGDEIRRQLDRAGEAMDEAEEALRQDDFAGALDRQAEAMEALREGMRDLAEQMAEQQGQGDASGDGTADAQNREGRDPLGRETGENGRVGTEENLLQGDDVYRRARELWDEIQRRAGDQERSEEELDYLRRLLNRF